MRVVGLPSSFYYAARHVPPMLGPEAKERLRWLTCWQALRQRGLSCVEAAQTLDISRSTLYRWQRCLMTGGPAALEDKSRRPQRRRRPTWSPKLADAVLKLREQYPHWGKDKLVVLLRREGQKVSASMVGRILRRLKVRGILREAPRLRVSATKRQRPRPYATRKPRNYTIGVTGDLVQVDTLDVRPLPGVVLKHFTARDVVSRWDVLEAHSRATATTATAFLDALFRRIPFPIKALQVDGGAEFEAAFEQECQERGIKLFVLPPRSPKLNGCVERAHRTHAEEFYKVVDSDFTVADIMPKLLEWERIYNTVRPHQALDGRTPAEYLRDCHPELASLSHML